MQKKLFGGLTRTEFMQRHWQKNPLVARRALAEYSGSVTRRDLMALAERDDVESRIVRRSGRRWTLQHGPFTRRDLATLPASNWTLLVQGVDQLLSQAARLIREFAFIPYARFDDVMVSYAAPGGGVGPHFDSYDVFLLQGHGERRWRISRQNDLDLVAEAPLKILRSFRSEQEWVLGPGDLLYLPPLCAHEGQAVGACITYSIGFRAPSRQELGSRFLEFLQDRLELRGMYEDPDLQATRTPGRIPAALIARTASMLEDVRWSGRDVVEFIGCHLTEPKANIAYLRPARPLSLEKFEKQIARKGLKLGLGTRMLAHGRRIYLNGESKHCGLSAARTLANVADARQLAPAVNVDPEALRLLYEWYRAGYVEVGAL